MRIVKVEKDRNRFPGEENVIIRTHLSIQNMGAEAQTLHIRDPRPSLRAM